MRRIVASLILSLALICVPLGAMSPWTAVAKNLLPSVAYLEIVGADGSIQGSCSGFVINSEKKYLLTAAHCDGEKVLANGTPTYKMWKDERKDLMVLRASGLEDGLSAFKVANKDPQLGDEVASLGYGMGLEKPMFRIAHISIEKVDIEGLSGPFIMVDAAFVGGQSGGAVINPAGELVMIVQRGTESLGIGVGAETIKDRAGRYFESKEK